VLCSWESPFGNCLSGAPGGDYLSRGIVDCRGAPTDTAFMGLTSCRRITIANTLARRRRECAIGRQADCRVAVELAAGRYTLICDGPGMSYGPAPSSRDRSPRPSASHRPGRSHDRVGHRCQPTKPSEPRVPVAVTPGHATTVAHERPPPAMGHQARSASGGRSYVPHRHAERVPMPPVPRRSARAASSRGLAGRPRDAIADRQTLVLFL
jgi:hypothetical protein